jgi:two-component system sensor histidine kinase MprB
MSALAVGVTVALASLVCYLAMRAELRAQVDGPLRAQGDRTAALDGGHPFLSDRTADGVHLRVLTVPIQGGGAVQIGRSLDGVDNVLARLRIVLVALVVLGTVFAAAMARLFSRPVMQPITDLTHTAEHIEATGDLGRRMGARGSDEVGRMAERFDAMLDRVQASQVAQRRLVADASHELRTPVTSLRTNMEVLLAGAELEEGERRALLRDMVGQSEELSALVGDLIELARGDEGDPPVEEIAFDGLVAEAVERARRHAPAVRFRTALEPCTIQGVPDRLGRAVNNVLDNAARHSPSDGVVEVGLRDGTLSVRDHGPGVAADELPLLFDRFFRGAGARERHGSGLGLAIVRQVVESHGGAVDAANAQNGGLVVTLTLPAVEDPVVVHEVRVA